MPTLIERLRGKVRVPVNDGAGLLNGSAWFERQFPASKLALEAAEALSTQAAEIAELKAAGATLVGASDKHFARSVAEYERAEKAEAENARLVEALTKLRATYAKAMTGRTIPLADSKAILALSDNALRTQKDKPHG